MNSAKPLKVEYPEAPKTELPQAVIEELKKITCDHLTSSSTTRAIRNIRKTLASSLSHRYNLRGEILKDVTDKLLKIHGIHEDNFDHVKNFHEGLKERINDISIDDNANKSEKVIRGYLNEIEKSTDKLIGYDTLYRILKDLYGQEEAKDLTGDMYTYALGMADSTNILLNYCYAMDASKLVTCGRDFGTLHSSPMKHVSSYISALCETVHQMSNHLAGACAIASFFMDISHLMIYKERRTLEELRSKRSVKKTIENEFQQFIHSINHASRCGIECPFSNISIFDPVKLQKLVNDYDWYFPNLKAVSTDNDLTDKMSDKEFQQYVISYILEVQNLFLDFFCKGDPKQNGMPYKFPVVTTNISIDENRQIIDVNFLKSICKRDISRMNIFASEGEKTASCCRLLSDAQLLKMASQVNSFGGGGAISMGSHRVITVNLQRIALECKDFEDYITILKSRTLKAGKILKAHKLLLLKLEQIGYQPFITNGYINPNRLFSTYGIMGAYEANKTLLQRFPELQGRDLIAEILEVFNQEVTSLNEPLGIKGNIEQIPGESYAVRLANADKIIYQLDDNYYPMYTNQFCPLWENVSLMDKISTEGKYMKLLTGGGISHIQIASPTTSQQNEMLVRKAAESGCEHFALNRVYSKCQKCGKVYTENKDICDCGSTDLEKLTRVVGYFTPVSAWNKTRREWEFPKRKFTDMSVL